MLPRPKPVRCHVFRADLGLGGELSTPWSHSSVGTHFQGSSSNLDWSPIVETQLRTRVQWRPRRSTPRTRRPKPGAEARTRRPANRDGTALPPRGAESGRGTRSATRSSLFCCVKAAVQRKQPYHAPGIKVFQIGVEVLGVEQDAGAEKAERLCLKLIPHWNQRFLGARPALKSTVPFRLIPHWTILRVCLSPPIFGTLVVSSQLHSYLKGHTR